MSGGSILRAALAVVLGVSTVGCGHTYDIEARDNAIHVWLASPALAAEGGRVGALIYVGSEKVVEGRVRFLQGSTYVKLPTVYSAAGPTTVSAVFRGGAVSATETVSVVGESWIVIRLDANRVSIGLQGQQPME